MGPKTIVMIDKYSERSHEVPCVQDQQPVQAFRPNRPNEPLRDPIRLRGLNRRTNNARALRLKDDIETARELSIMVANQESDWVSTLGERPCDVPRLLRHPFAVGIRRAAGQVHATTGDFDEEQHVQPLEPDGVDGKRNPLQWRSSLARAGTHATTDPCACLLDRAAPRAAPSSQSSLTHSRPGP